MTRVPFVAAGVLAALAAGAWHLYDTPFRVVKAEVSKSFPDPSSLQWRNLQRVGVGGVCGEVNGKNLFGAYTGFRRFHALVLDGAAAGIFDATDAELSSPDPATQARAKIAREHVVDMCDPAKAR